jgi:lipopolysaccharide/colanic/teichoic acid biosynthesis glycosyltransferase
MLSTSIPERIRLKRTLLAGEKEEFGPANGSSLGILAEQPFLQLLRLERKRAERSARRFVLMLLDVEGLLHTPGRERTLHRVLESLLESTRETDLKGWYRQNSVFGIIFTEMEAPGQTVLRALLLKVSQALSSVLTVDQVNEIKLSFHIFPESEAGNGTGPLPNFVFYKDLIREFDQNGAYRCVKRSIDIVGSFIGLLLLAPLFVIIAAAIRCTSRGPIFFRQERVGQFYSRFTFLKFRSMYTNADHTIHKQYVEKLISGDKAYSEPPNGGKAVYKITNDPRITAVGRFLRRTSLDELPQLINVLRGEMTLVGPRPCIPYEFRCYETWHRQRLLAAKPGITGLWQVAGRSRIGFDDMVRLDLKYVAKQSILLDLQILLRTPGAMFSGAGAY